MGFNLFRRAYAGGRRIPYISSELLSAQKPDHTALQKESAEFIEYVRNQHAKEAAALSITEHTALGSAEKMKKNGEEGRVYPSIEHSIIINNFVIKIGSQFKDSSCRVFEGNVFYQWQENSNEFVNPDVSINCNINDRNDAAFTGVPRFVMEVTSEATEEYDRTAKMEIYRKIGVSEYWIVDWKSKIVEIYLFDDDGNGGTKPYLHNTVTESNKNELQIVMFPGLHIAFEELFRLDKGQG